MAVDLETRALLSRVLAALGVAIIVPGCSGRSATDAEDDLADGESGGSESSSESGTSDGSTAGTNEAESESEGESESESSTTGFDLGNTTETTEGDACMGVQPEWFPVDAEIPPRCSPGEFPEMMCFEPPDGTTCEQEPFTQECLLESLGCDIEITCGPTTVDGACCYVLIGGCPPGRGFFVGGEPILAPRTSTATWLRSADVDDRPSQPDVASLDAPTRAALADVWACDAAAEHASVGSFARVSAQLLALGAPPALVVASVKGMADEVRHAQRCYGLASRYAGTPIGPGRLDLRACLDREPADVDAIAIDLAIEGCIVETVSTLLLIAARDRATDPAVRRCLSEIARDEVTHVVLAWEALAWLVGRGSSGLRSALALVFARAESYVREARTSLASHSPVELETMRAHGYLGPHERRAIALEVLEGLVQPAARTLLASSAPQAATPIAPEASPRLR